MQTYGNRHHRCEGKRKIRIPITRRITTEEEGKQRFMETAEGEGKLQLVDEGERLMIRDRGHDEVMGERGLQF